jgi:TonB family protein
VSGTYSIAPVPIWASRAFRHTVGWSIGLHVAAIALVALGPGLFSPRRASQTVFVDLVAAAPAPRKAPVVPPAAKTRKKPAKQAVREAVVIPKQPPPLRAKPKPAAPEPKALSPDEILAQFRAKLAAREPKKAAAASGDAGIVDAQLAAYKARIQACLYENWAGARAFSRRDDLEVTFDIGIDALGNLAALSIARSSADRFLEQSAERAIRKCAPFGLPPRGIRSLVLTFNPADLV